MRKKLDHVAQPFSSHYREKSFARYMYVTICMLVRKQVCSQCKAAVRKTCDECVFVDYNMHVVTYM